MKTCEWCYSALATRTALIREPVIKKQELVDKGLEIHCCDDCGERLDRQRADKAAAEEIVKKERGWRRQVHVTAEDRRKWLETALREFTENKQELAAAAARRLIAELPEHRSRAVGSRS